VSYYVRLLTPEKKPVTAAQLRAGLTALGRENVAMVVDETEDETDWTAIVAYTEDGEPIGLLTRDALSDADSLAKEELEDFAEELKDALPKSGAAWMRGYLKQVQTIYAVQLMAQAFEPAGEGVPGLMIEALRAIAGGVIQADGEGFSNEDGAQIVWQHDDDIDGEWTAAVLGPDKSWLSFTMDRADPVHRAAFQAGQVPAGVEVEGEDDVDE
jgi:hypothetical protein